MNEVAQRLLVQSETGLIALPDGHKAVSFWDAAQEINRLQSALDKIANSTGCVDACECHLRIVNSARKASELKKAEGK